MSSGYQIVWFGGGATHAVWPSGENSERDLAGCLTFCGIVLSGRRVWGEAGTGAAVTCKRCRRSLSARAGDNPTARRTLANEEAQP